MVKKKGKGKKSAVETRRFFSIQPRTRESPLGLSLGTLIT